MGMQAQLVDEIVRNVLRELRSGGKPAAATHAVPPANRGLVIDDGVVTESSLSQKLNGSRQVTFGQRTVITPSARDYLRSNGIEWTRGVATGVAGAVPVGPQIIATHTTLAVGSAFNRSGIARVSCEDAMRMVSESSESSSGVLVLTDRPHWFACQVNRDQRVRAIAIDRLESAPANMSEAEANCVCVKPNGYSACDLQSIANSMGAVR